MFDCKFKQEMQELPESTMNIWSRSTPWSEFRSVEQPRLNSQTLLCQDVVFYRTWLPHSIVSRVLWILLQTPMKLNLNQHARSKRNIINFWVAILGPQLDYTKSDLLDICIQIDSLKSYNFPIVFLWKIILRAPKCVTPA